MGRRGVKSDGEGCSVGGKVEMKMTEKQVESKGLT